MSIIFRNLSSIKALQCACALMIMISAGNGFSFNSGAAVSEQINPIVFVDGLKSRFITAENTDDPAVKKDKWAQEKIESDCDESGDRHIYLASAKDDGIYKVLDYKQGMVFIGAVASVNLASAAGAGVGLVGLFEGDTESTRRVEGLSNAENASPLKRPKRIDDIITWQVGDRLQYSLGIGGLFPIGAGVCGILTGFVPSVEGRFRVSIERTSNSTVKIGFVKERELGIHAGVGSVFMHHAVSITASHPKNLDFTVDISTDEGQQQLVDLLRYRHLFHGGMKKVEKITKESGERFIRMTMEGEGSSKTLDRKKLRVVIPFLLSFTLGTKTNKANVGEIIYSGDDNEREMQSTVYNRKTDYRNFTALNNIFKKKYRKNSHRVRQRNGVTEGMVSRKNGEIILSAQAQFNVVNNHLNKKHYDRDMARLDKFVDVGHNLSDDIVWPAEVKDRDSLFVTIGMKLDDASIRSLMSNSENLSAAFKRSSYEQNYHATVISLRMLSLKLAKLDRMLAKSDQKDDQKIAKLLRKIVNSLRKDHNVMRIINSVVPGAINASLTMSGTHIKPHTQSLSL